MILMAACAVVRTCSRRLPWAHRVLESADLRAAGLRLSDNRAAKRCSTFLIVNSS